MSITHSLPTQPITLSTAHQCMTVKGERISLLVNSSSPSSSDSADVHLTFKIEPYHSSSLFSSEEKEFSLIFPSQEALNVGIFLVAMALEERLAGDVAQIREQLSALIEKLHQAQQDSQNSPHHLGII